jgi:hypothetical protein
MKSDLKMLFREYLKRIQKNPTNLRIHIFQLMREAILIVTN